MDEPGREEVARVVIRDKRRIDPETGAAREPAVPDPVVLTETGDRPTAQVDARVAELTEDLQRVKAEYDNYRRRVDRDRAVAAELATAAVLAGLLPILDDVDRAREHGDLQGAFAAVGEALASLTGKLGLVRYGEPGEEFDPQVHEALVHSTSTEVTEATAVAVLRPGYRFAGRVLRPAQVAVAEPPEAEPPAPDAEPPDAEAADEGG
ncbi:MAG: nucleotide exchange factor GrpE [Mycobacteriales bacterium]